MAVVNEHVLTISIGMWVPVEDPSPKSKFQIPVEDSYRSHYRTVRELHILQSQRTLKHTRAKKQKQKLTQQKREEPNSAKTIHI